MDQYHRDDVLNMLNALDLDIQPLTEHDQKKLIADAILKAYYIPLEEAVTKAYDYAMNQNVKSEAVEETD